jgi:hypothetical protein
VAAVAACGPAAKDEVAGAQPPGQSQGEASDGGGSGPSDGGGAGEDGDEDTDGEEHSGDADKKDRPDVPKPDPADYPGKDEHTAEGAEQAFRYFIAQMIWSYQTGDTEEYDKLSGPDCSLCSENRRSITDLDDMGKYWTATSIDDEASKIHKSTNYDHEIVYVFDLSEHDEPIRGNTKSTHEDAQQFGTVGGMRWSEDGWIVDEFQLGPIEEMS